ncbi:MAG: hypothetical protein HYV27_07855 [Candidatus Hydrogenedentes bacterium]|nr:hypothetical protein [Candidatus Hydrogenedentota bacterium]
MTLRIVLLIAVCLLTPGVSLAYPEFQVFIEAQSGRNVNCAMCHAHPDGPEGLKPGQIGSLDPQQLEALSTARAAFEPGQEVHSPILNAFGNHIIHKLGKQQFLLHRQEPQKLAPALGLEDDLDKDGIPNAQELLDGTLPTDPNHGDPWKLFYINLKRRWFHILMVGLATVSGLWGLNNLLHGFERMSASKTRTE